MLKNIKLLSLGSLLFFSTATLKPMHSNSPFFSALMGFLGGAGTALVTTKGLSMISMIKYKPNDILTVTGLVMFAGLGVRGLVVKNGFNIVSDDVSKISFLLGLLGGIGMVAIDRANLTCNRI